MEISGIFLLSSLAFLIFSFVSFFTSFIFFFKSLTTCFVKNSFFHHYMLPSFLIYLFFLLFLFQYFLKYLLLYLILFLFPGDGNVQVFHLLILLLFLIFFCNFFPQLSIIFFGISFHSSKMNFFNSSNVWGFLLFILSLIYAQIYSLGYARSGKFGGFWISEFSRIIFL